MKTRSSDLCPGRVARSDPVDVTISFTTTAGEFRDALTTARHAVPNTPALVAYSGVLLSVRSGQLAVIGSDGETTIAAHLTPSQASDGQVLILPKPLGAFLATLPATSVVEVSQTDGGDIEVSRPVGTPYRFRPVAATFPLPQPPRTAPVKVDFTRLGDALASVRSATARENPGVQLVSTVASLTLNTTDNYRLARAELGEAGFGEFTGVLSLGVLERIARVEITSVAVDAKAKALRFAGPRVTVSARQLATPFPMVDKVLEAELPGAVRFRSEDLAGALARLAAVAEIEPLRCRLEHDRWTLDVANADLGSGHEEIELRTNAPTPFEFGVSLQYLADAVAAHGADEVSLEFSTPLQPLFLRSSEPFAVTTVVMPVRVG